MKKMAKKNRGCSNIWGMDNRNKANVKNHNFEKNQKKDFDPKKLKSGVFRKYTLKILFLNLNLYYLY